MKQPAKKMRRRNERRASCRRRLLKEDEFRKLVEDDKTIKYDRRAWCDRRNTERRRK